jgi:hypothetical protein
MKQIIAANPGRRVIVVSHSWGTVVTKMALQGGAGGSGVVEPANLGAPIDQWMTLGTPLGRLQDEAVTSKMLQERVSIPTGRPPQVKHWMNLYDPEDPIAKESHQLKDADANIEVTGGRSWWDPSGLTAHTAQWTNPRVTRELREAFDRVAALPPLAPPAEKEAANPKDVENVLYQKLANALVRYNAIDLQKRNASSNGDQYTLEYTHQPTAVRQNGVWYIAGGWRLKRCSAGDTKFYVVFERGDETGPNLMSTSEVDRWVSSAGLKWQE